MPILKNQLTWEEVSEIVSEEQFDIFGRSQESQDEYDQNKIATKGVYKSTKDMILINKLKHKCEKINNELVAIYDENNLDINLVSNSFPYNVEKNISHLLLWSEKDLTDKMVNEILKNKLQGKEFVYFRNPEHLRSIPSVFHIQIFVKN